MEIPEGHLHPLEIIHRVGPIGGLGCDEQVVDGKQCVPGAGLAESFAEYNPSDAHFSARFQKSGDLGGIFTRHQTRNFDRYGTLPDDFR